MNTACEHLESGAVELYFYEEMAAEARAGMTEHIRQCHACATALDELRIIRAALASRPDVSAPPSGDWSAFMERLDTAVRSDPARMQSASVVPFQTAALRPARAYVGLLATAALLALVTMSVFYVASGRTRLVPNTPAAANAGPQAVDPPRDATPVATAGMRSVGEQHFERSKLVVLGLASKEPSGVAVGDWAYERTLASSLLNDTRLYRMAAEERGLTSLAGVMRDLELVLLETSMAQGSDPAELPQIQRLIRKRQLLQKMHVVNTVGLTP